MSINEFGYLDGPVFKPEDYRLKPEDQRLKLVPTQPKKVLTLTSDVETPGLFYLEDSWESAIAQASLDVAVENQGAIEICEVVVRRRAVVSNQVTVTEEP